VEVGARIENLMAAHNVNGAGASLLATEAGLSAYHPASRTALMLGYSPSQQWELRLESGQEDVAGVPATYVALRVIPRLEYLGLASR
jgi:hypothetical protein